MLPFTVVKSPPRMIPLPVEDTASERTVAFGLTVQFCIRSPVDSLKAATNCRGVLLVSGGAPAGRTFRNAPAMYTTPPTRTMACTVPSV